MIQQENGAAIYLRLSRDDRGCAESESIASQRLFLRQYAAAHGLAVTAEFADDGISGTKWERPGLQALLAAIEDGLVQTVLVKDLSRLSRDYIRTGELLERWFPAHGVRLIAVSDGVDTAQPLAGNDFSPMRAVMDDWYARDVSRKVRAAIHARQQAGFCTAATLPYGYQRSPAGISADPARAETVRRIFAGCLAGESLCGIARRLNAEGVPSPGGGAGGWNDTTLRRILTNTAYTGQLRLHVTEKSGYKSSTRRLLPAGEHCLYPVPAIVPESVFRAAQQMLAARRHRSTQRHWLSGLVYCGCCGRRMVCTDGRLICGGRRGHNGCRNPSLRVDALMQQLRENAIALPENVLRRIIRRVTVTQENILVDFRCADFRDLHTKPAAHPD